MVTNNVAVRKQNGCTLLHDQQMRHELLVTLIHNCRFRCRSSYASTVLLDEDHDFRYRHAIGIDNVYFDHFGVYDCTANYRQ